MKSIEQRKSKRNIFIPLFHLVRHESPRCCCHRKICEQVHNTPRHRQQSVGQVVLVCQGLRKLALSCRSCQRPWRQLTKYSCHLIPQIFGRYMITWHLLLPHKMLGFFPSAAISNTLCVCVNWWGSAKIDKNLTGHPESLWFFLIAHFGSIHSCTVSQQKYQKRRHLTPQSIVDIAQWLYSYGLKIWITGSIKLLDRVFWGKLLFSNVQNTEKVYLQGTWQTRKDFDMQP